MCMYVYIYTYIHTYIRIFKSAPKRGVPKKTHPLTMVLAIAPTKSWDTVNVCQIHASRFLIIYFRMSFSFVKARQRLYFFKTPLVFANSLSAPLLIAPLARVELLQTINIHGERQFDMDQIQARSCKLRSTHPPWFFERSKNCSKNHAQQHGSVREYSGTGYGLPFSTEIYGSKQETTVFHEYPQEACFVLAGISEHLPKPPGAYRIV